MTWVLSDHLEEFQDSLLRIENAALSAGVPYRLVMLHKSVRYDTYNVASGSQHRLDGENRPPWRELESQLWALTSEIEQELQYFIWHPWRARITHLSKVRKFRRRYQGLLARSGDWELVRAHKARVLDRAIRRANGELDASDSGQSRDQPPDDGAE